MFIFKYEDQTDFRYAYVIAPFGQQSRARKFINEVTDLPLKMIDSRPVDDFAEAVEFFNEHGEGIWKNEIFPF